MKNSKLVLGFCLFVATLVTTVSCNENDDTPPPPAGGGTAGPKFTAAKSVIVSSCGVNNNACHSGASGRSFATDNDIVSRAAGIKNRAVTIGDMAPGAPLSAANKAIISAWVDAGGRLTD
jgi:uncharacterized membrane protein